MVCPALDHRDLLQDSEDRMPDRGAASDHGQPPDQLHRAVLRRGLARVLANDAPVQVTSRIACSHLYRH